MASSGGSCCIARGLDSAHLLRPQTFLREPSRARRHWRQSRRGSRIGQTDVALNVTRHSGRRGLTTDDVRARTRARMSRMQSAFRRRERNAVRGEVAKFGREHERSLTVPRKNDSISAALRSGRRGRRCGSRHRHETCRAAARVRSDHDGVCALACIGSLLRVLRVEPTDVPRDDA